MDRNTKRAIRKIKEMARAWQAEGHNRKYRPSQRVTYYLASAIAERCAEIVKEEAK